MDLKINSISFYKKNLQPKLYTLFSLRQSTDSYKTMLRNLFISKFIHKNKSVL